MQLLLKTDKNLVNAIDSNGRTLLHFAAEVGKYIAVRCLVDSGADVNMKASFSLTCMSKFVLVMTFL